MEIVQALWFIVRVALLLGLSAASITFAVVLVCRWQKWAPINITVNNYVDPTNQ